MAWFSYAGTYWKWILLGGGFAIAFGAIAYFLHNWRAAVAAGLIVFALILGGGVYKRGYDKKAVEDRQKTERILKARIATLEDAAKALADQKIANDAEVARLQKLIDDAKPKPGDDRVCIDDASDIGAIK